MSSSILQAAHYNENEIKLSKDIKVTNLLISYLAQGGSMESLDHNMLAINKEAHKRGIEAFHIGAVVGAFKIVYYELQVMKKSFLDTTEADGFTAKQVERFKEMAEEGGYKFIKLEKVA